MLAGGIEKIDGSDDIGVNEIQGGKNGTVYMRLGRKVDYAIGIIGVEDLRKRIRVEDIRFFKNVVGPVLDIAQVLEVAGIS